jgi:hypothetical protein
LAPEIDGVVYVGKDCGRPGEFVKVVVQDAVGYDLIGGRDDADGAASPSLLNPVKKSQGYR